jgi:tetratricopeptide (TPR) repeat protein
MDDAIRRQIRLMVVEANSRTIPRAPGDFLEIAPDLWSVLRDVEALHARGDFLKAAALLVNALPEEVLYDDPWVTNALALSLSQDGREEEAWPFFLRSEQLGLSMVAFSERTESRNRGLERAARAATNLSISFKKVCRYAEAIEVAERAIGHAPWFWPAYTALVAALEGRGSPEDKDRSLKVLDEISSNCTGANEDEELFNALERDADYSRIRKLGAHTRFNAKQR